MRAHSSKITLFIVHKLLSEKSIYLGMYVCILFLLLWEIEVSKSLCILDMQYVLSTHLS